MRGVGLKKSRIQCRRVISRTKCDTDPRRRIFFNSHFGFVLRRVVDRIVERESGPMKRADREHVLGLARWVSFCVLSGFLPILSKSSRIRSVVHFLKVGHAFLGADVWDSFAPLARSLNVNTTLNAAKRSSDSRSSHSDACYFSVLEKDLSPIVQPRTLRGRGDRFSQRIGIIWRPDTMAYDTIYYVKSARAGQNTAAL